MSIIENAICWHGAYAKLCLEDEVLQGKKLVFYELTLDAYPQDLKAYLVHVSAAALAGGAELVWFQFDGGFHFENVLSQEFAQEVYFLQPEGGVPSVAIDDDVRAGEGWAQVVLGARRMLAGGHTI